MIVRLALYWRPLMPTLFLLPSWPGYPGHLLWHVLGWPGYPAMTNVVRVDVNVG
jgi:hypothetical protein